MPELVNQCQGCGWIGEDDALASRYPDIERLGMRTSPGEIIPSGECPECGALCHVVPMPKAKLNIFDLEYLLELCRSDCPPEENGESEAELMYDKIKLMAKEMFDA